MENKTTEWMSGPVPTVCRCCLAEGCYKDISTEYFWMGKREVYAEMLSETFDLSIAYAQSGGPNSHSRLICEPCISRLRDASEFKKQVQECEKTFMNHLDPCSTTVTVEIEPSDKVKLETVKEEQKQSDSEDFEDRLGFEDDDDDDLDDQPLTKLASKPLKKEKADLLDLLDNSQITVKRKSTLKAKAPPAKKAKLKIKEKAKPSPSKAPTKTPKKKKDDDAKATAKLDDSDGLLNHISVEFEDDTGEGDAAGARRDDGGRAGRNKDEWNMKESLLKQNSSKEVQKSIDKDVEEDQSENDSHDDIGSDTLIDEESFAGLEEGQNYENRPSRQGTMAKNTNKKSSKSKQSQNVATRTSHAQENMKENTLALLKNSNTCLFMSIRNKFKCFFCNESYFKMVELRGHSEKHSNLRALEKRIKLMRGITYKSVDISSLCCNICNVVCADLVVLTKHLMDAHDLKISENGNYIVPYRLVTDEDFYECVLCDDKYNSFKRLKQHMNTHFRNHTCETCGAAYTNPTSLRTHILKKHRVIKCSICQATFGKHYSKHKHMIKHHNVYVSKRYCILCDKTFRYTYQLEEHKINEHGFKRLKSVCVECGKVFSSEQNLKIHMRSVHLKERNFPCGTCSMGFFSKHDQKRHEVTHEDVKSFGCNYCDARFKTKASMRKHEKRIHGRNMIKNVAE